MKFSLSPSSLSFVFLALVMSEEARDTVSSSSSPPTPPSPQIWTVDGDEARCTLNGTHTVRIDASALEAFSRHRWFVLRRPSTRDALATSVYTPSGARGVRARHTTLYAHTLALGEPYDARTHGVTHRNDDAFDCRRANLVLVRRGTVRTKDGANTNNSSTGIRGVSRAANGTFIGRVQLGGELITKRGFASSEEAGEWTEQRRRQRSDSSGEQRSSGVDEGVVRADVAQ